KVRDLAVNPVPAALQDVGTILLQCVCGLFLNVRPWPRSQALKALRLIRTDRSVCSRSTISFSVISLRSSISPTMKASCASRLEARLRPCGRGDLHDLDLAPGAIVLVTVAVNVDMEGRPIEFAESRFAADRVELSVMT